MWTKSYSIVTQEVTKEQMWKLYADVNHWHLWDGGIEYAKIERDFTKGESFILKPKSGPKVKIELIEASVNKGYYDLTRFPLAKMYGDHLLEETPDGLKITVTMSVKGLLSFLWVKLVAQDIINTLPITMKKQIEIAKKF